MIWCGGFLSVDVVVVVDFCVVIMGEFVDFIF